MSKRLLLWDIDSTLLWSGGAGDKALKRIVRERYGVEDDFRDIEIAGRTDRHIVRSILRKYKVEPNETNTAAFLENYLTYLAELLPQLNGRILPGVKEILDRMHARPDRVLALLTGNLQQGAKLKLQHFGLWDYFEFGAFADDHYDRNELGPFARARGRETRSRIRRRLHRCDRRHGTRHRLWKNFRGTHDCSRDGNTLARNPRGTQTGFPFRRLLESR